MCGIAGLVYNNVILSKNFCQILQKMSMVLKHRGPDDEGFAIFNHKQYKSLGGNDTQEKAWNLRELPYSPNENIAQCNFQANIGLVHRRLSIIDLSELAHLPMCTTDARYWITYNGEIYNYIELREELKSFGYNFITNGDTEVILAAYDKWGDKCLERFDGMWAFVIYDRQENILFGARDRFGVKPFYYYLNNDVFAFASEIKAILQIPEVKCEENEVAVFEHLFLSQTERYEQGFFNNIIELQPSYCFVYNINKSTLEKSKYYYLKCNQESTKFDCHEFDKHKVNIKQLLFNSIEKRLRADVPIGFCLSGGLDSTCIVSIADIINKNNKIEQLKTKLHTFTATHINKDTDESRWAEIVAANKFEWYQSSCTSEDLLKKLKDIIYYQEVPLFSTSTYAQSKVMQLAKQNGITILLDGQGGDEIFAGYPVFFISYYIELLKKGKINTLINELSNLNNSPINKSIVFTAFSKIFLEKYTPTFLEPTFNKIFKSETRYFNQEKLIKHTNKLSLSNDYSGKSLNNKLLEFQTEHYLKKLLRFEDRCSMQYQIESRTPFADDKELIEYMFNLPSVYKIHQGWSKFLLRESVKDIIPEQIRLRTDKKGFSTPNIWLKEINNSMKLTIQQANNNEYINNKKLLKDWDKIFNKNQVKAQELIWRYYNYLIWKDVFFNKQ